MSLKINFVNVLILKKKNLIKANVPEIRGDKKLLEK
jgi:hypothetical protein